MADDAAATLDRYRAYADRIASVSPTYATWARSVDDDLVALLLEVAPSKRQPELLFAVARRLGADPRDPAALRALGLEARPTLVTALASATVQANDPRRMAPLVPFFATLSEQAPTPLGIVDVGAAAGLCSIPDRVTLDYVVVDATAVRGARTTVRKDGTAVREDRTTVRGDGTAARPGRTNVPGNGTAVQGNGTTVRMADAVPGPSIRLVAEASGAVPAPASTPIRIGARIALDPNPIDLAEPGAFDRLVEAVPPEATDRTALMREAARATLHEPPGRIRGTVPGDLDAAVDRLPDGCTPVVLTTGTLVYVPGADRQRFVDRIRDRGVHWIAMERTGILRDVAATLPDGVDPADPDAFATVSVDGVAVALADAFGTRVRFL
jgi:hypothetical protein